MMGVSRLAEEGLERLVAGWGGERAASFAMRVLQKADTPRWERLMRMENRAALSGRRNEMYRITRKQAFSDHPLWLYPLHVRLFDIAYYRPDLSHESLSDVPEEAWVSPPARISNVSSEETEGGFVVRGDDVTWPVLSPLRGSKEASGAIAYADATGLQPEVARGWPLVMHITDAPGFPFVPTPGSSTALQWHSMLLTID